MRAHGESHVQEDFLDGLVPVVRTSSKTMKGLLEDPKVAGLAEGTSFG
jgi:hypothetical protein